MARSDQERVLWTLTEHGGSMTKSDLARRLQIRQTEVGVVLQELERAGKIKLTEIKGKLVVGLLQADAQLTQPSSRRRSRLRYHLARKRPGLRAGGSSGNDRRGEGAGQYGRANWLVSLRH